jgi:hypothetical protein
VKKQIWLVASLFAWLYYIASLSQTLTTPDVCRFDWAKMLALDFDAFDHDPIGGW